MVLCNRRLAVGLGRVGLASRPANLRAIHGIRKNTACAFAIMCGPIARKRSAPVDRRSWVQGAVEQAAECVGHRSGNGSRICNRLGLRQIVTIRSRTCRLP